MPSHTRTEWDQRYQEGPTPWDTRITPPEVKEFWQGGRLPCTGRALDLGCGPGTNVTYLARLGLHAIGIDFASIALARAQSRLSRQSDIVQARVALIHGDVTNLPFHRIAAAYILDIGCLHGLRGSARPAYAAGVKCNLAPYGYYHLFAFDRPENPDDAQRDRGMEKDEVALLFAPELEIVEVIHGEPDRHPCRWYLLQKTGTS